MLEEVRDARLRGHLVPRSGSHPEPERDRAHRGDGLGDDSDARVELGYLGVLGHEGSDLAAVPAAAVALPPASPAVALAPASSAAVTAPGRPRVAGADAGELLRRLALDVRIVREAQPDPAALLVDLDRGDLDLVALVEDVLDGADPLAGLHVRDVKQAVGALGELDEGAEVGGLHHFALELVADLNVLGHRDDPLDAGVDQGPGGRVYAHYAVVVDVDLGLELLRHAPDRLAALADHGADLLGVDLDRGDPRRELRELLTRPVDRLGHPAEDELPALVGLIERIAEDVEGDAGDLDVHLEGGDALLGSGDLEVHVAQVVLDAGDVGEHDVVVALLDQPHRDAGDRRGHGDTRGLERHRGRADGAHRRRAVRLE